MRQANIVVGVEQPQLVPHAVLALAQRGDPPPDCRHTLPDVQVEPLDKGRLDLPAAGRQQALSTESSCRISAPAMYEMGCASRRPPVYL
jgi:hypothetical protein